MIEIDVVIECSVTGIRKLTVIQATVDEDGIPGSWTVLPPKGWILTPTGPRCPQADFDPSAFSPESRDDAVRNHQRMLDKVAAKRDRRNNQRG